MPFFERGPNTAQKPLLPYNKYIGKYIILQGLFQLKPQKKCDVRKIHKKTHVYCCFFLSYLVESKR